jgi:hypothetical protein
MKISLHQENNKRAPRLLVGLTDKKALDFAESGAFSCLTVSCRGAGLEPFSLFGAGIARA